MFHPSPDAFILASPALPSGRVLADDLLQANAVGFSARTLVETECGWRPVGGLTAGTRLATLDGGFVDLIGVRRTPAKPIAPASSVLVPGGALGNCDDVILGAAQRVLLPTGPAEPVLDAAFALVTAAALAGHFGIRRVVTEDCLYRLDFASEEVVWANSGLLLHCPAGVDAGFLRLDGNQARALIGLLEDGTPFPALGAGCRAGTTQVAA
jgi:hypothetical protein